MYYSSEIKGETFEEIEGHKCYIPPKPPDHEIAGYGLSEEEQYWRRTELPDFSRDEIDNWSGTEYPERMTWFQAFREEQIKQKGVDITNIDSQGRAKRAQITPDPFYVSHRLQEFRQQEFERIQRGYWFFNKGKATYITGDHYFYLNWWRMDTGYPDYWEIDRKFFYLVSWVRKHPTILGLLYITQRGVGKSYKAGAIAYLEAIRGEYRNCVFQSKTDDDAKMVFRQKMCQPADNLPEFLKPINNHTRPFEHSDTVNFTLPIRSNVDMTHYEEVMKPKTLSSSITYANSNEVALDGWTIAFLHQDEVGKTDPSKVDVRRRWQINYACLERGGEKRGFGLLTTTVEKMEKGGKAAKNFWKNADVEKYGDYPPERITRFFASALDCYKPFIDKYGFCDSQKAKDSLEKQRSAFRKAHDNEGLIGLIQKHPYTIEEALASSNQKCEFNILNLNKQRERITEGELLDFAPYIRGNFHWSGDPFKSNIFFERNEKGLWNIRKELPKSSSGLVKPNNVEQTGAGMKPMNGMDFRGGYDPTKDPTSENKRSSAAAASIVANSTNSLGAAFSWAPIADMLYPSPPTPEDAHMEMLKGMWYFGAPVLIEKNVPGTQHYFKTVGCEEFLLDRPVTTDPSWTAKLSGNTGKYRGSKGMESNGWTVQYQLARAKTWVARNYETFYLPRSLDALIEYNHANRTKHDLAISQFFAIIAWEANYDSMQDMVEIEEFMPLMDHSGIEGHY